MKQTSEVVESQVVDFAFPVTQGPVPLDHGYLLYAALSQAAPELHGAPWLAVHPLGGRRVGDSTLMLTPGSQLVLRLPSERIPFTLGLSGQQLRLGDRSFLLGAPTVRALRPSVAVFARRVAIRLTKPVAGSDGSLNMDAFHAGFENEARRQLKLLEIDGELRIVAKKELVVKTQKIIAFSVRVDGLNEADSLKLQTHGLGGKRRMGCGVFGPAGSEG